MTRQHGPHGPHGRRGQRRQYRLRLRVRVRTGTVVTMRRRGEHVSRSWDDIHEMRDVRYDIEWDPVKLHNLVARAVVSSRGTARGGPITAHVHPTDRVKPTTMEKEEP